MEVLYKEYSFRPYQLTNMAATGKSCFKKNWSISKTAFPLKPLGQMIWNLVRSTYGRSSIEITHFVLIHLQTWLPQAIPDLDWSISENLLIWNCFAKMNRYLVGSTYGRFCIKFLKAEWKVNDTGSAHWASSNLLLWKPSAKWTETW
jgi:hypothetical protein